LKSKRAEIKVLRASEKRSAEKRTAKAKATQCPHKSEGAYFGNMTLSTTLRSILIPELLKSKRAEIKFLRASEKAEAEKRTAEQRKRHNAHTKAKAHISSPALPKTLVFVFSNTTPD